jgi:hypothetical protein
MITSEEAQTLRDALAGIENKAIRMRTSFAGRGAEASMTVLPELKKDVATVEKLFAKLQKP